ncbi:Chaperone-dependent E3 ubiquitin protein ligase (contains TPR repeats) protein [Dioscorea alata]|uniref:Chaperone-dependent E3 ubiquitin protein ligase (Contains TPR repeats) protein n=1 Tax=Dioscorea alata TaxID=55571 RepID=A0ACB7VAL3_DIOAL|nr:Chaperone-dependent E3 ubiquitin protein ligase (contains TPR repeats) protein [Dioscorea alata]
MAPVPASVAKQAELLRMDGNTYFKKDRIGAAIDAYTEAIALCPNVAVYWTNRALCYRKREEWARVEEDCRRAIAIDSGSVKAHYMLGLALLEKQECTSGIKELEKALDLGRGANPQGYMVEEIWLVLAKAKYNEWKQSSSERLQRLQNLRDTCEKALKQHNLLSVSEAGDSSNDNIDDCSKQFEYLSEVFHKAALADRPSQISGT